MKKYLLLPLLTILVFTLVIVQSAGASVLSSYSSSMQIQNLSSSSTANIVITFYNSVDSGGGVHATVNDTVAAGASNTYFPLPAQVSSGFSGSAVVSSDQPIAAVTNVVAENLTFGSSYSSVSQGAQTNSLPVIMKNNFNVDTWFSVQNTGTSTATVNVSYSGSSCTEGPVSIGVGEAKTFDQVTNTCLPAGYVGAATVTAGSGETIATTVLQVGSLGLFAYNGFSDGDPSPLMPLIQANNFTFQSSILIQNQGGSSTDVTVTYTPSTAGSACTETRTIAGGDSSVFMQYAFSIPGSTNSTCTFGQKFVGSAQVTSNTGGHNLVAVVNQTNFTSQGSSYNAFSSTDGANSIVMPLIMDQNFNFFTGFNVMNVGGSSTTVTCDFSGVNSSYNVVETIAPLEAFNHNQLNYLPAGYVGSVTCTASGGGSIIGVANELNIQPNGDTLFTYEAATN